MLGQPNAKAPGEVPSYDLRGLTTNTNQQLLNEVVRSRLAFEVSSTPYGDQECSESRQPACLGSISSRAEDLQRMQ
jgi:hypothetical protein